MYIILDSVTVPPFNTLSSPSSTFMLCCFVCVATGLALFLGGWVSSPVGPQMKTMTVSISHLQSCRQAMPHAWLPDP